MNVEYIFQTKGIYEPFHGGETYRLCMNSLQMSTDGIIMTQNEPLMFDFSFSL